MSRQVAKQAVSLRHHCHAPSPSCFYSRHRSSRFLSRSSALSFLRLVHHDASSPADGQAPRALHDTCFGKNVAQYKKAFDVPRPSDLSALGIVGANVTLNGFLSNRRVMHSKLVFADLDIGNGHQFSGNVDQPVISQPQIQLTSSSQNGGSSEERILKELKAVPLRSAVSVVATVVEVLPHRVDLKLESIQTLSSFPTDIIVSDGTVFPPSSRHLQIRFSDALRTRLIVRNIATAFFSREFASRGFLEVETPLLFKSTPEGASEFLVPSRRKGMAYALPQSPQQYKQLLMASGVRRYYQFARCFRDEDLRADRQPEFTQLDLEMSFATAEDVMATVEQAVKGLLETLARSVKFVSQGDSMVPELVGEKSGDQNRSLPDQPPFPRISYETAMTRYGSDKPDLRIPFTIQRVDQILPSDFVQKISKLEKPIVEAIIVRWDRDEDRKIFSQKDAQEFMDSLPGSMLANPDGGPAPLRYDPLQPLNGLSALGFEAAEAITALAEANQEPLEQGDFLIFQARENKPFQGGSTALGRIRTALYEFGLAKKLLPFDDSFKFLWVNEFPMFTPDNDKDPGQGGTAGFSATHHPFTAPFSQEDFDMLATNPLGARGASFDLVVNGIELGGGSRRIHIAQMQEDIMRDVLQMSDARIAQFAHLLEALRAGCPPHAGFALGFDRLIAVLTYAESLRDVIAFPKSKKAEDLMVKSPARITDEELARYHLLFRSKKDPSTA